MDWLDHPDSLNEDNLNKILISCDIKGNIFKWNVKSNESVRYFSENKPATQIKACPNSYLIAVG